MIPGKSVLTAKIILKGRYEASKSQIVTEIERTLKNHLPELVSITIQTQENDETRIYDSTNLVTDAAPTPTQSLATLNRDDFEVKSVAFRTLIYDSPRVN